MRPVYVITALYRTLNNQFHQTSLQWAKSKHLYCARNYSSYSSLTPRNRQFPRVTLSSSVAHHKRSVTQPYHGIAHDANLNDRMFPELSMSNDTFSDFVKHLVENKLLAPRHHVMLTSKLSDYELRVADLLELSVVVDDDGDVDDEFRQLARLDLVSCEEAMNMVEMDIVNVLLNAVKEDWDDEGIDVSRTTVEFEGGAGGQESMIFNNEIFEMYQRFANYRGWRFDVTEFEGETSHQGTFALSRASAEIQGKGAYDLFKFEAGVHRVQRVPVTEKKGKLQTSTCVVIVTPTITNPQIDLRQQDLKFAYFRSSGAGGQSVNTTNSAVRVTHVPTGISVECQDERSQIHNAEIAVDRLRSRLYAIERERILQSNQAQRKVQIGTRERSDKIRTYNFQQGRVTDHRITTSVGAPEKLLEGGALLEELIESVSTAHRKELLLEKLKRFQEEKR